MGKPLNQQLIAIVTDSVTRAKTDLKDRIASISKSNSRRGIFKDGPEFVIVTRKQDVVGAKLDGVLHHGLPNMELVMLAQSRVTTEARIRQMKGPSLPREARRRQREEKVKA